MAELAFIDYFGLSNMSVSDYIKLSGIDNLNSISALEAASLLADAPEAIYDDLFAILEANGYIEGSPYAQKIVDKWNANALDMTPEQVAEAMLNENVIDVEVVKSAAGENLEIQIPSTMQNSSLDGGKYNGTSVVRTGMDASINEEGKVQFTNSSGTYDKTGEPVHGFLGTISSAIMSVATIAQLGRIVSKGIYEGGKLFGKDLEAFDPDTWHKVTAGNDSFGAVLFNCLFVVNPNTKAVTMYVDSQATVAALTSLCGNYGWFINDKTVATLPIGSQIPISDLNYPIHTYSDVFYGEAIDKDSGIVYATRIYSDSKLNGKFFIGKVVETSGTYYHLYYATEKDDRFHLLSTLNVFFPDGNTRSHDGDGYVSKSFETYTYNGKTFYTCDTNISFRNEVLVKCEEVFSYEGVMGSSQFVRTAWIALFGKTTNEAEVPGLTDQHGANLFTTPTNKLTAKEAERMLKTQYPKLWNDSITRGILQSNGTVSKKTFIPLPIPATSDFRTAEPTTGNARQDQTSTNPSDTPPDGMNNIGGTIGKVNPPDNTPGGDSGNAPSSALPIGGPSSLWAVYNPTQEEIDAFGSWMWSSNPFEQIKKLFNDPMQAIIGVHKVFAPPSVAGRRNIKVGYIDSGVNSNYIGAQYSEVSCGSVSLAEHFGNVFDYSPFTSVSLYLPFVGVVQLDTADVMRSTISVSYGVDVLTGDCLAKVNVERDGAGGIIYSYPGNCAVKYPISSGSYMSIVGYAAGAAATIFTGNIGMFAPVEHIFGNRPTVQHGGAFTGNTGATGPKIPYLIISRQQSALAKTFNKFEGYPTNYTVRIGDCDGYIKVHEVHLSGINATDEELDMIEQILMEGIIVQSD